MACKKQTDQASRDAGGRFRPGTSGNPQGPGFFIFGVQGANMGHLRPSLKDRHMA